MSEETLKQRTAKGLFWGGVSNGVQQLLGMLFGIYLARLLNAEDYGLVGMLAIFTGIAGTIINSGFTVALTNKQDASHKDYNAVFWFTFFVGLACYVILFFLAPLISKFYARPELTSLSRVVFISFFFSGCAAVSHTVLFKRLMVKQQAQIDITAMLLSGVVGITLAMKGYAYWALALQSVTFISVGALLRFFLAPWKPTFEFDFKPLREMFSFSSKLFITNIFWQISSNQFSVLLGKFYNAQQVGYYSQGYKWMVMGNSFIGGMINGVAQPVLAEIQGDPMKQQAVFRKMVRFGAFISFPLMLGLAFVANEFILIAIGNKWLPCVPFLQLFCLWGAVGYLWALYTNLLMVHGKSDVYMWGMIVIGLLQIAIVALAFPFGILWMVAAYVASFLIGLLGWQYYANRLIGLQLISVIRDIFPYLLITGIAFVGALVATYKIENVYFIFALKIIVSVFLYIMMMWLSNSVLFKECLNYLRKK